MKKPIKGFKNLQRSDRLVSNKFKNELKCLKDEGNIAPQLYYKCLPRSSLQPKLLGLSKIQKPNPPLLPLVSKVADKCSKQVG